MAQRLSEAFARHRWNVWWDRKIPPGKSFDQVISEAMDAARCVVVLWSKASANSDWVKEEATEGLQRGILIPVLIEDVKIPLGFRRIHAARLSDWNGDDDHPDFNQLKESIKQILSTAPSLVSTPLVPEPHSFLGGTDIGTRLIDYLADEFNKEQGVDLRRDSMALQRLKEAAEKARIELSSIQQTDIELPFITADATGPKHLSMKLTRAKLESLMTKSDLSDVETETAVEVGINAKVAQPEQTISPKAKVKRPPVAGLPHQQKKPVPITPAPVLFEARSSRITLWLICTLLLALWVVLSPIAIHGIFVAPNMLIIIPGVTLLISFLWPIRPNYAALSPMFLHTINLFMSVILGDVWGKQERVTSAVVALVVFAANSFLVKLINARGFQPSMPSNG